jgi:membrane-bound lytic murein transglycosylase B
VLNRPRPGQKPPRIRTGPPEPADVLKRYYREAHARTGVSAGLLAAVNLVESDFGRVRNNSVAGAQGPMQFMPATWKSYGRGGDIHDPHDAILGAARFLAAAGARTDEAGALYRYNPSRLYVTAVRRYTHRIRTDPLAFYAFYASGAGD